MNQFSVGNVAVRREKSGVCQLPPGIGKNVQNLVKAMWTSQYLALKQVTIRNLHVGLFAPVTLR